MYSIVDVAGEQTRVTQGQILRIPKLETEPGKSVTFEKVMLVVNKDEVVVGNPVVANATVKATVIAHGKGKKVLIFKKKRRKTYQVLNGHRQEFTEVRIDAISVGKDTPKKEAKTSDDVVAVPEEEAVKAEATKAAPKKAAPKKAAAKKATAKDAKEETPKPKAASKKASAAKKGEEE